MPTTTAATLISKVNYEIHNAKGKLGGDTAMLEVLNSGLTSLRTNVALEGAKRYGAPFVLYGACHEYAAPSDLSHERVVELIDEAGNIWEFDKTNPREFYAARNPLSLNSVDRLRNSFQNPTGLTRTGVYAVDFNDGDSFMLIRANKQISWTSLHSFDSYSSNGTWTASNDAASVGTDTQVYRSGASSVIFDTSGGATTATLTNSDMTAVDLSGYTNGRGFFDLYVPTTPPTSITVKWGSSASAYHSKTVTTQQNGLAFKKGWNVVGFDWRGSTPTGSSTDTAIDYAQIALTFSSASAQTGFRLDNLRFGLGVGMTAKYYSTKLVRDGAAGNAELAEFADTSDYTILRENEVNLLVEECTQIALMRLREFGEAKNRLENKYIPMLALYASNNPDQTEPRSYTYYNIG